MAGYKIRQAASTAASEIDETKYHLNQRHLHHQLTGFPVQVDRLRDDVNTTTQVRNYDADTIEDIDGDDNNNQSKQAQESVICQESSNTDKIHCNVTLELEDSSCKSQKRQSIKVEPASSDVVKMSLKEPTTNKTCPSILNQPRAVRGGNGRTHERGNVTKRDAKKRMRCNDLVDNNGNKLIESHKYKELVCSCNRPPKSLQQANLNRINIDEQNSSENSIDLSTRSLKSRLIIQHALVSLGENNGRPAICNKHMPWFGIDVGGSLVKVVFFDPKDASREEMLTLRRIRRYLKSSKPYGSTGKRDDHLEMPNCLINKRLGTLHFIRFATSQMPQFLEMAKNKQFADTINTVCATGGGACKYEQDIKKSLGITLHKTDELDSVIYGIHYIDKYNPERECYFLQDPLDDEKCVQVPYDFSSPYPYLVVNIGSGVSILAVYSSTSYSRISGSSIGGGTFLGLCCLLTQCKTFDEAIKLAKAGSSSNIDKLVKDIYGGDYPKFNLSGDTVASSFGHMNMEEKRKNVKREDLARALLEMVTINIGSIARMCAANENIDRVVFIGNFLRVNQLSMKLLSYAVNYWSKGAIKALFLEHEGYFGAVGCFVESTQGCRNQ